MRKAGMARPVRDERIANLENRGPAWPGDTLATILPMPRPSEKTLLRRRI